MKLLKRLSRFLVACFRLNGKIVCQESSGRGLVDYHDYPDTKEKEPWHMAELECERCGKKFII